MKHLYIRFLLLSKLVVYLNTLIKRINNFIIHVTFQNRLPKKYKNIISINKEFSNCHKNIPAYVIVNGPSLKNQNLAKLEGELILSLIHI
jgi:hypothetical protein